MENNVQAEDALVVTGARENNLKNVSLTIPQQRLVVITGLSGSGKSSLAFDTIYAEGQRRYMETYSAYARRFIGSMEHPDVDKISGLNPVISIEQKTVNKNPRSTVGTVTEVYDFLRLLYARVADAPEQVVGDVDGNGVVDVDDLNIIINIMVGKNSNPDFVAPADIDGNGNVDVDDLNRLINIMLHRA